MNKYQEKQHKTALITGASGGIGSELCRLFALDKVNLVLVARNRHKLSKISDELQQKFGIDVQIISLDLAMPGAVQVLYQMLQDQGLTVDYLINNAGVGHYGQFKTSDFDTLGNMLNLNITALVQLTRMLLPDMLHQGGGRILNVASLAAFQPAGPNAAAYYASKCFVLAFNRALAVERRHTPVTNTVFCPGPLSTNFSRNGDFSSTRLYRYFSGNLSKQVKQAYQGFHKGKPTIVSGFMNKLLAIGGELPPRSIALSLNKFLLNN